MGHAYAAGGIVKKDLATAKQWYEKAAGQGLAQARQALDALPKE